MKHAYLIIAHNEPEILQLLVSALDDVRNDIYIHIDRKADGMGTGLSAEKSKVIILTDRLDARWGDFSLVEVEYLLFETAFRSGPYAYYHLLSGVDLPIKSQDHIHDCCERNAGSEFIGFARNVTDKELAWRGQHYFLFPKEFQTAGICKRILRGSFARLQSMVHYRRTDMILKKGSQWCSVTHDFVDYLLQNRKKVKRIFTHTYCPDELFIQTLCWNSDFRDRIFNPDDEFEGCRRYIRWEDGVLQPIGKDDLDLMISSDRWFARKFTGKDILLAESVIDRIR